MTKWQKDEEIVHRIYWKEIFYTFRVNKWARYYMRHHLTLREMNEC